MRPEELMVAKLKDEARPIRVKWKRRGKWYERVAWVIKGTTHALYLPKDVKTIYINFAGQDFVPKDEYNWDDQTWSGPITQGPWYPEGPGRSACFPDEKTWLFVRRGRTNRVSYRRVEDYGSR